MEKLPVRPSFSDGSFTSEANSAVLDKRIGLTLKLSNGAFFPGTAKTSLKRDEDADFGFKAFS